MIGEAGISRQTFYLRRAAIDQKDIPPHAAASGNADDSLNWAYAEDATTTVEAVRRLRGELAAANDRVLQLQQRRVRLIASLSRTCNAETLAAAAGVTPTWVRRICRDAEHDSPGVPPK